MELIDKDALVAEIESRIKGIEVSQKAGMIKKRDADKKIFLFKSVLTLIDTLEVNEVQEEPVSEDLVDTKQTIIYNGEVYTRCYKDELDAFACKYPMSVPQTSKKYAKYSDIDLTIAIKEGAKWQKAKDQSTIELAEDHAMFAGMEKMKEQMMAEAIDVEVKVDAGGYPYIDKTIELYDYDKDVPLAKAGDKYKVVLIKKD